MNAAFAGKQGDNSIVEDADALSLAELAEIYDEAVEGQIQPTTGFYRLVNKQYNEKLGIDKDGVFKASTDDLGTIFKLTVEDFKDKVTERTKLLILPFPNNPTGAIMTKEDLEPIAEFLRDTNIMVLSDEIYSELTYGRKHFSIIELEGMRERTIKAYAMTGWRLGYVAAPEPIISQVFKIHQYGIMCSPYISQNAAVEALTSCESEVRKMVEEYNVRRRYLVGEFNRLGLPCFEPEGAFYVFPCIKSTGLTSEEFCERLLYEERVAAVPGSAFGESGEGYMRISYAYSLKHLMEAIGRIEKFLQKLEAEKNG